MEKDSDAVFIEKAVALDKKISEFIIAHLGEQITDHTDQWIVATYLIGRMTGRLLLGAKRAGIDANEILKTIDKFAADTILYELDQK